jgi:alkanesulfonate monooxygenase SsuD/methylene tetrahydromethanopterin reductase-like flavin-dependent oxidoreductase (luciferase family)
MLHREEEASIMKLGIYLNSQHPAGDDPARRFAETIEQARLIRALGFDSVWSGRDHSGAGAHDLHASIKVSQHVVADGTPPGS